MIPADENLTILTALKYGATIYFNEVDMITTVRSEGAPTPSILSQPDRGNPELFPFTKEGCYGALKHLQKNH